MHLWELEQLKCPVPEPVRFEQYAELYEAVTPSYNDLDKALNDLAHNFTPTPDPLMIGWSWTPGEGGSQWPDLYPDLLTVWGVRPGEVTVTAWCAPVSPSRHTEQEIRAMLIEFSCRTGRVMLPEPEPGEWEKMLEQVGRIIRMHADKTAYAQQHPPAHWDRAQLHRWSVRAIANGIAAALDDVWGAIRVREWSAEMVLESWHSHRHDSG